jgi:branched-chain amino acid:cation transporter, LIVCS family
MKKIINFEALSVGLAMFSMFFGAGNVIFPLAIGQHAGDKNLFAILGLIITAVIMPFAGVFAMILYDGNHRHFFYRLGKIPGFLLALMVITLLGPLGSTPRCIALTYSTLKSSFPMISPVIFSAVACTVIFIFTVRRNRILDLLGYLLTPLLLTALAVIVFLGFFMAPDIHIHEQAGNMFFHGLQEGYNTMDLLAAFFFSSTILSILKNRFAQNKVNEYIRISIQASTLGALLLAIVYVGFSFVSAIHGENLDAINKDELLSAITLKIAGPYAGILVCTTIALTCLTTAIALISVFSDFIQQEVFKERISYETTLMGALLITFAISTLQFTGISAFLGPILQICYPGLIVLTFLNISHKLTGFEPLKIPVFFTFALSVLIYLFN